jgi:hypothetical protein
MKVIKSIAANMVEEQSRTTKSTKSFAFKADRCAYGALGLPRCHSIVPHLEFDFFCGKLTRKLFRTILELHLSWTTNATGQ